ncbi:hypothetical protein [Roseofilum casamattae]|uniref:Actin-binding WH2 domain-containing protein n=1 Tax=Roseofilum casamattae BLCC-M143 TaxID=3022442 RepID=A0ABT7BUU8_9CYAN|nr:hypothetical protein [Roseofilum casamattae]MDJ1182048.1 actin-binding WH2 domain-containing protein [Roseofilum casamattae BLCC-M143]
MKYFAVVMDLLRERELFLHDICEGVKLKPKITGLLISSSIFFAAYGLILGAYSSWYQALISALKLPALYLLTMVICFPTLYFFNIMFGSRRSFEQYLCLLMTSMAVISVLLFGFAPVSLFFLLSTKNYHFFLLLNVVILGISGGLGVQFFYQGMQRLTASDMEGKEIRHRILLAWLSLYAFVGSQLAWTLRPFFGSPGKPFELFRDLESNFYLAIWKTLVTLLGW